MNIIALPLIHFFYVETAGRSLEEINLLFTSDSPFVSANMAEYERRIAEAGGNIAVASRRLLDEVNGTTDLDPTRRSSVLAQDIEKGRVSSAYVEEKGSSSGSM